jgi:hypothetical protein
LCCFTIAPSKNINNKTNISYTLVSNLKRKDIDAVTLPRN